MIMATHNYEHLTKYADLIICMKNGTVAELGSHKELIKSGGEYSRLLLARDP